MRLAGTESIKHWGLACRIGSRTKSSCHVRKNFVQHFPRFADPALSHSSFGERSFGEDARRGDAAWDLDKVNNTSCHQKLKKAVARPAVKGRQGSTPHPTELR